MDPLANTLTVESIGRIAQTGPACRKYASGDAAAWEER
jgi:hypothetical protein